jgi:hypothetical protein
MSRMLTILKSRRLLWQTEDTVSVVLSHVAGKEKEVA